ncbi:MAG: rubrerythrin family protein [Candidatus Omnitrophica bacterium]|nr:rubrerythrin family protein [Candidatus Omnitrophota bacterium]
MHEMTKQNLETAFAGESQAHMKYRIFADMAQREGKKNIARLFAAVSYAEQVHAQNHLRALGKLGKTGENLQSALAGETFEISEMYPVYHAVAEMQGEKEAQKAAHYALEAEKIHAAMYKSAGEAAAAGKDIELQEVGICPVCGYTVEGEVPEFCPVCGAKGTTFKTF